MRLEGEPHPQGRPRARIVREGFRQRASVYEAPEDTEWKRMAAATMRVMLQRFDLRQPLFAEGALELHLGLYFELPKTYHRKRQPVLRAAHVVKPDASNVLKAVEDAGNGVLWDDDSRIARVVVEKLMGAQGEQPRVELHVFRVGWPGLGNCGACAVVGSSAPPAPSV